MARRPRNAPAHPQLLLPRSIVTLGGSIAALCSRPRSPLDWEFATHTLANARLNLPSHNFVAPNDSQSHVGHTVHMT